VRSEDGGVTSGPEDGVPRRRSQVKGQKAKAKRQNRREERKSNDGEENGVRPARQERWKEGSGAGLDTVTGTGAAAVAGAETWAGTDAVSGSGLGAVAEAGTRAGSAA